MTKASLVLFAAAVIISGASVPGGKALSRNMVLSAGIEKEKESISAKTLSIADEREIGERDFIGEARKLTVADGSSVERESPIRHSVMEPSRETEKAFFVSNLSNRCNRNHELSVFVEIPRSGKGSDTGITAAGKSAKAEFRFVQTDRYDPDLPLDRTERMNLEEKECKKSTGLLAGLNS